LVSCNTNTYDYQRFNSGDWDDLNEPFVPLLMLVRAVNEANILAKVVREEIDN
jgi:hypothetical protein